MTSFKDTSSVPIPTLKPVVRFSSLYTEKSRFLRDSPQARKRIEKYYVALISSFNDGGTIHIKIEKNIEITCGIDLPYNGYYGVDYGSLFEDSSIETFLDIITVVYNHLPVFRKYDGLPSNEAWRQFCVIVFEESGLGYKIDPIGVVHLTIDEEFQRQSASIIDALSGPRYGSVSKELEKALASIQASSPDTKAACKYIFEAVEILFRLIFPNVSRLGENEIKKYLKALLIQTYSENKPAVDAATNICNEFSGWVNWLHIYRHGQPSESPTNPPFEIAVLAVSAGISYLRFLGELDQLCPQNL